MRKKPPTLTCQLSYHKFLADVFRKYVVFLLSFDTSIKQIPKDELKSFRERIEKLSDTAFGFGDSLEIEIETMQKSINKNKKNVENYLKELLKRPELPF